MKDLMIGLILGGIAGMFVAILGYGFLAGWSPLSPQGWARELGPVISGLLSAGSTSILLYELSRGSESGSQPNKIEIRTHWGGLGGGVGGIIISPAILLLVVALFFAGVTILQLQPVPNVPAF